MIARLTFKIVSGARQRPIIATNAPAITTVAMRDSTPTHNFREQRNLLRGHSANTFLVTENEECPRTSTSGRKRPYGRGARRCRRSSLASDNRTRIRMDGRKLRQDQTALKFQTETLPSPHAKRRTCTTQSIIFIVADDIATTEPFGLIPGIHNVSRQKAAVRTRSGYAIVSQPEFTELSTGAISSRGVSIGMHNIENGTRSNLRKGNFRRAAFPNSRRCGLAFVEARRSAEARRQIVQQLRRVGYRVGSCPVSVGPACHPERQRIVTGFVASPPTRHLDQAAIVSDETRAPVFEVGIGHAMPTELVAFRLG